ncbi:anti-sigma factor (TIGR02949 family) [Arcanobacterium pluranimalium]|uniref:mycothiol system anti-sigma-R factor n=1 Tax=Arcanobacterium pluranimalium TaxID=108028 RepID=UPI00195BDA27|nr:mycothiol system anti-sigma-R factor [Arcanobacterium pluranimalium]MBM7825858.1 anti-sigma factor (TIGR02949 family) [Arcanobacterium pluranimalium]
MDNQHEQTQKIDELVDQLAQCQSDPNCSCGDVVDSLFELLDHEIPVERAEILYTHGQECVNCSEQIAAEMRIREIVRRSCTEEAPSELRMKISQFIVQYRRDLG